MVTTEDGRIPLGGDIGDIAVSKVTVRTWMATQIMAGYRASKPASVSPIIAELAVRDADALIKELNK